MSEGRKSPQRLAVFGAYSDHDLYQRNRTLVRVLDELSDETLHVRPKVSSVEHGFSSGKPPFSRLAKILVDAWSLWTQRSLLNDCDTIFVPYPAYVEIVLLWMLGHTRQKRVIVDAFLELHSTVVEDRELLRPNSLRARLLKAFQRFTLSKANLILIDTAEHASQLRSMLADSTVRVADVPVGIDEHLWPALAYQKPERPLELLFWGTFIPLHGVDIIIDAVRILQAEGASVTLTIIGDGQTASCIAADLTDNPLAGLVWHRKLLDVQQIVDLARTAHIVLGVFGTSVKADSVVPYKVHQALALNKPVVTREASPLRAIADSTKGLALVAPGNSKELAAVISELAERLENDWKPTTRDIYEQHFAYTVVASRLRALISRQ